MITILLSSAPDYRLRLNPLELGRVAAAVPPASLQGLQFEELTGLNDQPLEGLGGA